MPEGNLSAGSGQQSIKQLHLVVSALLLSGLLSPSFASPTPYRISQRRRVALAHFNHGSLPLIHIPAGFITPAARYRNDDNVGSWPQAFESSRPLAVLSCVDSVIWRFDQCLDTRESVCTVVPFWTAFLKKYHIGYVRKRREGVQASHRKLQKSHTLTSAIENCGRTAL